MPIKKRHALGFRIDGKLVAVPTDVCPEAVKTEIDDSIHEAVEKERNARYPLSTDYYPPQNEGKVFLNHHQVSGVTRHCIGRMIVFGGSKLGFITQFTTTLSGEGYSITVILVPGT